MIWTRMYKLNKLQHTYVGMSYWSDLLIHIKVYKIVDTQERGEQVKCDSKLYFLDLLQMMTKFSTILKADIPQNAK